MTSEALSASERAKFYVEHDGERFEFADLRRAVDYFSGCILDADIGEPIRLIDSDGKTCVAIAGWGSEEPGGVMSYLAAPAPSCAEWTDEQIKAAIQARREAIAAHRGASDSALPHHLQAGERGHVLFAAGEEEAGMRAALAAANAPSGAPRRKPTHIRQQDTNGCALATVAMVLGLTYEQARNEFGAPGNGFTYYWWMEILGSRGWSYQMRWRTDQRTQKTRAPWPPAPWAPLHICNVDAGRGDGSHACLMLADGTVLDPARDAPQRLGDYASVSYVAALYPAAPPVVDLSGALARENDLAKLPALIVASIEEDPTWFHSAALVTAHAHASVIHADLPAALEKTGMGIEPLELATIADLIVRDVAELPDRTSPDDWPEAMLVTGEELHALIVEHFTPEQPLAPVEAGPADDEDDEDFGECARCGTDEHPAGVLDGGLCPSCCDDEGPAGEGASHG